MYLSGIKEKNARKTYKINNRGGPPNKSEETLGAPGIETTKASFRRIRELNVNIVFLCHLYVFLCLFSIYLCIYTDFLP